MNIRICMCSYLSARANVETPEVVSIFLRTARCFFVRQYCQLEDQDVDVKSDAEQSCLSSASSHRRTNARQLHAKVYSSGYRSVDWPPIAMGGLKAGPFARGLWKYSRH